MHDTIAWLGRGDAAAAFQAVKPSNRTQVRPESDAVEPHIAEIFDLLYTVVDERQGLTPALIAKLNEAQKELAPRIAEAQKSLQDRMRRRPRGGPGGGGGAIEPDEDPESQPSW